MLATYLLEARPGTFLKPDATNTPTMVLLLSGVGVATGIFFFVGRDLYSTIVLHNAFAIRGVIQALDDSGNLDRYSSPQLPLIATAIGALMVLLVADVVLIRPIVRRNRVA
jgi:hypothetical protein